MSEAVHCSMRVRAGQNFFTHLQHEPVMNAGVRARVLLHARQTMSNLQTFSATKECDFRRGAVAHGAGRLASAYDRLDYDDLDEDTIEMVLSPEEMQSLNQSAEEALAEAKATRAMAVSLVATLAPIKTPAKAGTLAPVTPAPGVRKMSTSAVAPGPRKVSGSPRMSASAGAPGSRKAPGSTTVSASAGTPTSARTPVLVPVLAPAETPAPPMENSAPKVNVRASGRVGRWSALRVAGAVSVVVATAVALASMTHHSTHTAAPIPTPPSQTAPVLAAKAPVEATAAPDPVATPSPPPPQPVRVKNPFDRSEVFEFPPGTSLEEARHSVADTLMQRAHDRGIRPLRPARADRHPVAQARTPQPVSLVQNSAHGAR